MCTGTGFRCFIHTNWNWAKVTQKYILLFNISSHFFDNHSHSQLNGFISLMLSVFYCLSISFKPYALLVFHFVQQVLLHFFDLTTLLKMHTIVFKTTNKWFTLLGCLRFEDLLCLQNTLLSPKRSLMCSQFRPKILPLRKILTLSLF